MAASYVNDTNAQRQQFAICSSMVVQKKLKGYRSKVRHDKRTVNLLFVYRQSTRDIFREFVNMWNVEVRGGTLQFNRGVRAPTETTGCHFQPRSYNKQVGSLFLNRALKCHALSVRLTHFGLKSRTPATRTPATRLRSHPAAPERIISLFR